MTIGPRIPTSATAATLFRRGRRLAAAAALVLLAAPATAAFAADPTLSDCLAANENASRLQAERKLRESREQAAVCAAEACPTELHDTCRRRVAELNKSIPTVVFQTEDAAGNDVTAVKVTMDGTPLVDHLVGTAVSVDPGPHTFRFEAAGHAPVVRSIVVIEGQKDQVESITFEGATRRLEAPAPAAPTASPSPPPRGIPAQPGEAAPSTGSSVRTTGLVLGGVGLATLVAGGVFGALSVTAHASYEKNCGATIGAPASACTQAGVNGEQDAATKGTVSTVLFVVGAAAVASGAVFYFMAPSGPALTRVGIGPGSFALRGAF